MKGVIYRLVNRQTGMSYVGQTINLKKRLRDHKSLSNTGDKEDNVRPIVKALREFGFESFDVEILYESDEFANKEELTSLLDEKEIFYIEKFNSIENGYNLTKGGKGMLGLPSSKHQKETVRKLMTGRIVSEKEREEMSIRAKKMWTNEDIRKRISEKLSGENNPHYGKKYPNRKRPDLLGKKRSEETRRKISEAKKGKGHSQSEETRRKISETMKGVPKSESHQRNAAKAKIGKKVPSKWKPVLQYSTEGVFIKEWQSIREPQNIYNSRQIGMCARGRFNTIAGYIWRYKISDEIPQKIEVPKPKNFREVAQVDKDGNIIQRCPTLRELSEKLGLTYNVARRIMNGYNTRLNIDYKIVYLD